MRILVALFRRLKKIALMCCIFGVKKMVCRTVGRFPRIYVIMKIACNFLEVASILIMLKITALPL